MCLEKRLSSHLHVVFHIHSKTVPPCRRQHIENDVCTQATGKVQDKGQTSRPVGGGNKQAMHPNIATATPASSVAVARQGM